MMAAESGSTDVSTDDEDVGDLASKLTSQKEVRSLHLLHGCEQRRGCARAWL